MASTAVGHPSGLIDVGRGDFFALKAQILANACIIAEHTKDKFDRDSNGRLNGCFEIVTYLRTANDKNTPQGKIYRFNAMLVYQVPSKRALCVAYGFADEHVTHAVLNLHGVVAKMVSGITDRMDFGAVNDLVEVDGGYANSAIVNIKTSN